MFRSQIKAPQVQVLLFILLQWRQEEGVELVVEALPLHHAERDALPVCAGVLIRTVRGVQVSHD